ncbi:MAG: UDP-2,3-diacylglucosamine diphosphatase [Dysgonamonadaceae bacterium]|jgi:UDP-2,3-diacylglucosamine pyrophosphatase LpxH|nr:UDP-2,3-diacylglucosamine diphosphatase [Dysgonamonadaceae bacterium]
MEMNRTYYPTVILSDIHLGTSFSKTTEVAEFLQSIDCDRLILNGDIIDGWHLQRKSHKVWKKKHILFFRVILKMMENFGTEVIYVRGNHDDFLDSLTPICFYNLKIVKDYILERNGKRYYVTHGDIFDPITSTMKWLSKFGDVGYTLLLHINKYYNHYRAFRGKPYYSFAQDVKQKFKSAVSYIADFEASLAELAKVKHCDGIICGHIHHPENKYYSDIHYLNSGDWIDSLSALAEDEQGNWKILFYDKQRMTDKQELKKSSYVTGLT